VRVEWRPKAREDLAAIVDYIDIDSPQAALAVFEEIQEQIGRLAQYPQMGRVGRVANTRELVINRTPYVAVYQLAEESIIILRVLHGARKWPPAAR
jgi:toxin ParE1/3/4